MSKSNISFYKEAIQSNIGSLIIDKLQNESIKDVILNENGILFENRIEGGFSQFGNFSQKEAEGFLLSVAAYMDRPFNYYNPRLRGELPKDRPFHGERIEAMCYPAVDGFSFTIRKPMIKILDLEDYVNSGQMTRAQFSAIDIAIREKKVILVSGGTGVGKTTLLNAIIRRIVELEEHSKTRLYVIQDVREITSNYANATFPRTCEALNMNDLLESGMRSSATRIIVGEMLGKEAFTFMAATNVGLKGAISTVHANDAKSALIRVCTLLETHGYHVNKNDVAQQINVVVQLGLRDGIPMVKSIGIVEGYNQATNEFLVNESLYSA